MSRVAPVVCAALLLLLATGCRLTLDVALDVDRDGGGDVAVALAADAELRRHADQAGADPLDDLAVTGQRLAADGWTTSDNTADDGSRTVTLSRPFADPAELARVVDDLTVALDAEEVALLSDLGVAVDDETVTVRGEAGLEPTDAVTDYGLSPQQVVRRLERSEAFSYTVTVGVPGEVVTTSAPAADDGLSWSIAPGETVQIEVVSDRPWSPWLRALIGGLLGLLAAVLLLLARKHLRRGPAARSVHPSQM